MTPFHIFLFIVGIYLTTQIFGIVEIGSTRYIRTWDKIIIAPKQENLSANSRRLAFFQRFPRIRILLDVLPYLSCLHYYYMNKGYNCALKYPEFGSIGFHDAIILTHGEYAKIIPYGEGIDLIIEKFQNNQVKIPYKIYDCQKKCDFIEIVRNPLTKNLWIFGHGERGGIRIGFEYLEYQEEFKKTDVEYENLKKNYVYQFHCNGGIKPSLADLLSDGRGYVSNTYRDQLQNREHIRQILKMF